MITELLVGMLRRASDKLREKTARLRSEREASEKQRRQEQAAENPDFGCVIITCVKCGAFRLETESYFDAYADGYPRKCVMCGEAQSPVLVTRVPVGSALWTDGQVKVRTSMKNELVINRPAVKS